MWWWKERWGRALVVAGLAAACGRSTRSASQVGSGGDASGRGGASGAEAVTGRAGQAGRSTGGGLGGKSGAGSGGGSGRGGRGGEGGVALSEWSCVYQQALPIDSARGRFLDGVNLGTKLAEGCEYELGRRMPLPVDAAHGRLLFHYDLNGDQIDDLFFGESSVEASSRSIQLLMSNPYSSELSFTLADCEIPLDLTYTRIFARDLDGDHLADRVVATPSSVRVFLNQADGLREVGQHEFGSGVDAAAVEDVVAVSFDDTQLKRIVVGYDFAQGRELAAGAFVFEPTESPDGPRYAAKLLSQDMDSGYVADWAVGGNPNVFGLGTGQNYAFGWLWQNAPELLGISFPDDGYGAPNLVRSAVIGNASVLAVGYAQNIAFYELANPPFGATLVGAVDTYFEARFGHELGGGQRTHSRFLRDLDWDDDSDLIELDRDGSTLAVVVSLQESPGVFSRRAPLALEGTTGPTTNEDPFLTLGSVEGRVLVRDAELEGDGEPAAPALQSLVCLAP